MKATYIVFLLAFLFSINCEHATATDCRFGPNSGDLGEFQPLLLITGSNELLQPPTKGVFSFKLDDSVDLACTSEFAPPLSGTRVTAYCKSHNKFSVDDQLLSIRDIQCTSSIAKSARKTTRICYNNSTVAEIGFSLNSTFIAIIEVCFNATKASSYYSHYSLYPASMNYQQKISRPGFEEGDFYGGMNMSMFYSRNNQEMVFRDVISPEAQRPIVIDGKHYLSRGHLAAKTDFILGPSQNATFFYINAAPSWSSIDSNGWYKIEYGVRKLAHQKRLYLEIYTGVYGISKLPRLADPTDFQELYLGRTSTNEGLVAVPRLIYKVVIDKGSRKGIVLIAVNNPYLTLRYIEANEIICTDVSHNITWISLDKTIHSGYCYACNVDEFVKKVPDLPFLNVSGPLY